MTILIHGNKLLPKAVFKNPDNYNYKHVKSSALTGSCLNAIESQQTALCFEKINRFEDGWKDFNHCLNDFFDLYLTVTSQKNSSLNQLQLVPALNPAKSSTSIDNIIYKLDKTHQKQKFKEPSWIDLVNAVRLFKKVDECEFLIRPLNNSGLLEKTITNVDYMVV